MAVKVVTDSTSDIPPDLVQSLGITVVPCNVNLGTETFKDGVDLSAEEFYDRLVNGPEFPNTSQPSPGDFIETYERAGQDADAIVSVHVSSKLSGTYNSAMQAKDQADVNCPIELVDSAQASCGMGVVAIAAARAASRGADAEEVAATARGAADRAELFFLLDTLEYLQKGGRVGKAKALVGSILKIKPMIILGDGIVHEMGKARTFPKGVAKLQETARGFAPLELLMVPYTTSPDVAQEIAESLRDLLPEGEEPIVARAGPTIGTYAGPGAVGIGLLRAEGRPRIGIRPFRDFLPGELRGGSAPSYGGLGGTPSS